MRALLSLILCAALAANARAAAPPVVMAVVSKGLPGVVLYDAATDREICRATLDVAPHEAAFTADGRTLVVPIYSSANIGQPGPDGHTIVFLRTADCSVEAALDTGEVKRPHYAELGRRTGLVYVTAEQDEAILVVDPRKHVIRGRLPTGSDKTHFFALSSDERRAFTSNVSDGTLSVIDVRLGKVLATVDAGASNQRMTVSPDDRWFVTSLWQSGRIAFYRTSDHQLDFDVPVEGSPFVARFSPDGRTLYNMGMPPRGGGPGGIRVWKVDVATRRVVATSTEDLGTGTGGIEVNPVNGRLYLTAYSGTVSVLDPQTLKLLAQFPSAATPDGLFFGRVR
jgi:DNA-binding beta-propeller fold protein YncE